MLLQCFSFFRFPILTYWPKDSVWELCLAPFKITLLNVGTCRKKIDFPQDRLIFFQLKFISIFSKQFVSWQYKSISSVWLWKFLYYRQGIQWLWGSTIAFIALNYIQLTTFMSSSRKKFSCDQIPLLSVTQKLRQNLNKTQYKKRCCDKENLNQSKERKQSKCKQGNSSTKKLKKKRYLEQQVQKLLQKRCLNEQTKMNEITQKNAFEFEGLRVDLKEMKDALNKLSLEEKRNLKQNTLFQEMENKDQFEIICSSYKRKIDDLRTQLEAQKQTNAKLQQSHIQSQLVAQQTKDQCQSITKQLADLGQKHLKCGQTLKELNENKEEITLIKEQKIELQLKVKALQSQKQSLNQLLQAKEREQGKLKQRIQQLTEECKEIKERQQLLRNENKEIKQQKHSLINKKTEMEEENQIMKVNMQEKQQRCRNYEKKYNDLVQQKMRQERKVNELSIINMSQISKISTIQEQNVLNLNQLKNLQQSLARQKQKVVQLTAKSELLSQLKSKFEYELKRLQSDFNSTKLDLGNTKQKLGGLSSMQRKCEELYMEIKLQKQRCVSFNLQTTKERQHLQNRFRELENERDSYISRAQKAQSQTQKLKSALQETKSEYRLLLEEKNNILKQIRELQEEMQDLQTTKLQITKQNEVLRNEVVLLKDQFNQMQRNWEDQLQKYEYKHQKLQKQKSQIDIQVREAVLVMKKKNHQLQALNSTYQSQISKVNQQKLTAISQLKIAQEDLKAKTIENEMAKTAISYKENLIYQLQSKLNQAQNEVFKLKEQAAEQQQTYKKINSQWQKRCYDIKIALQQLQIQTQSNKTKYLKQHQLWKENYYELEKELQIREEKLLSLSEIKQTLEEKLHEVEYKLEENQTIRLSLSSELLQHQQTTRRNQQVLQEEKKHLEKELKLKNKTINQLKQTVKIVRDQSMQIREEVLGYNKCLELEELFGSQVYKIKQTLDYLIREKEQLYLSITILKSQNNELSNKVFTIETEGLQWPEKEARYKETIPHLEKQLQTLSKQRDNVMTIFREKLVQQESRYEILRRKYQNIEHQKYSLQKEMENQNISLRVLKEENKNIEKVMAEQLGQRKGIIQQLMTEKRMLYAQLNQQR